MSTLVAMLAALGPASGSASAGGASATWWFADGAPLVVLMEAPSTGWVAVGFNDAPTLDGSRLVMAAVVGDTAVAEEHHARPPEHPRQRALTVRAFEEGGGLTRVLVEVPVDGVVPGTLRLAPGVRCGLTLAWSVADDFTHHSRWRGLVEVPL